MANKSKTTRGHFIVNIQAFEGDPKTLSFFKEQTLNVVSINKWNDQEALTYVKSRLAGNALEYYTQSLELQKAENIENFFAILAAFYIPSCKSSSLQEFDALYLEAGESIKNFAHRLNVTAARVFQNISDQSSLNEIKFLKFLSTIPTTFKIKIKESNITSYNKAVQKAQYLQDILEENKTVNNIDVKENDQNLHKKIEELKEQINLLTSNLNKKENPQQVFQDRANRYERLPVRQTRSYRNQPKFQRNIHKTKFFNNQNRNVKHNSRVSCHFCGKIGHIMRDCRQYLRHQYSNPRENNYNSSASHSSNNPNY